MTTIQFAPWRRAPLLLLVASLSIGIVTHALFNGLIRTGEQRVLAVLLCSLAAAVGFILALQLTYPRFAFDTVSRTVRMGRHTVALDSVREAWRSYQAGSNGATYLIYRFRSTEGPTVRVMKSSMPLTRWFRSVALGSSVCRREKASRRCVRPAARRVAPVAPVI